MRVIHLNTYDEGGGAARATDRLNNALKKAGAESDMYTFIKFGKKQGINALYPNLADRLSITVRILAERFLPRFYEKDLGLPFSLSFFGKDIHKHPALQSADIIHLHWVNHGFLNPLGLRKLALLQKPIVWTMHDSNSFTGGCHSRFDCQNYKQSCGFCPLLKEPANDDVSHQTWKRKKRAYDELRPVSISPSNWLADAAKKSGLLQNFPIHTIPNTLDTAVFKPTNRISAREALGINPEHFVLLAGYMPSRKDAHKGSAYLVEAIDIWVQRNPDLVEKATLVIFGNRDKHLPPPFKIPVKFLGTIKDDEVLAKVYAAADAYLTTTLDDNLPNTVMESLACGTPVISFNTGGIPDMVVHQQSGYLAKYKDADNFADGITWLYQHSDRESLRIYSRKKVMEEFNQELIAQQHIQLYQTLSREVGDGKF